MRKHIIIFDYILWHYSRSLWEGWNIWMTFTRFVIDVFAIPVHLRTLFTRFKKLGEPYPHGFQVFDFITSLIINAVMRAVGFVARLIVVAIGLVALMGVIILGGISFIVWLLFPAAVFLFWVVGILLIIGL